MYIHMATAKKSGDKRLDMLLESNLVLQHKISDMVIGTKDLNGSVKELIKLFKSAGEHIKSGKYEDPMINKINELLDQNKNLAQALHLLEDYVKQRTITKPSI
jgi:hypothetical protein